MELNTIAETDKTTRRDSETERLHGLCGKRGRGICATAILNKSPKAIVFDLGGVISSSPFTLFRKVEKNRI